MQDPEHLHIIGKSQPMTVITVVRPYLVWPLRIILWAVQKWKIGLGRIARLRFIHFAQWTIIKPRHFARSAPQQMTDKVGRHYFMFSTNYNGPWDQYIDSFSMVEGVRRGIALLWGASARFPLAYPVRPFKRYIHYHQYPVDAYYNAYPDATIRDIQSALRVVQEANALAVSFRAAFGDGPGGIIGPSPAPMPPLTSIDFPRDPYSYLVPVDTSALSRLPPSFETALRKFIEKTAPHLGSTQHTRTPTKKASAAPQGIQP